MINQCIEYLNCPTELGLYFDTPTPTTIHLREHIACQYNHGTIPQNLTLTIIIAPHTEITIIDDLCCSHNHSLVAAWRNKLTFHLNHNSILTYHLGQSTNRPCKKTCNKNCNIEKELHFILQGKGAQAQAMCSCMGTGNSNYTFTTTQEHRAPQTTSLFTLKGALADQAKLKSNALIKVYKGCAHVFASQINKNLLLSPKAHALSIPKLEIETDNVSCRHDATASKINQEQLFYLQSRGISAKQAQRDLVNAFLG